MADWEKQLDIGQRNEIIKLLDLANSIYKSFGYDNITDIDLDRSNEFADILFRVYTAMERKRISETSAETSLKVPVTVDSNTKTVEELVDSYCQSVGFKEFDYLIATPLMEILTAFKLSFIEVGIGLWRIPTRRREANGKTCFMNVEKFCLHRCHMPLLHGITFNPSRRTALLNGLGPLTLAIWYVQTNRQEIRKALLESINMLPMASEIVQCLSHEHTIYRARDILKSLGDILLLFSQRFLRRTYFPLEMIMLEIRNNPSSINAMNFMGVPAIKFYMQYLVKHELKLKTCATADVARQAIFHAMFGTNSEDLAILSETTDNPEWKKRLDMNDIFTRRDEAPVQKFHPIKYKYVFKPLRINPTYEWRPCIPVFAGRRIRSFPKSNPYLEYRRIGRYPVNGRIYSSSCLYGLKNEIYELGLEVQQSLDNINKTVSDTTSWLIVEDSATGLTFNDSNFTAKTTGVSFYS